MHEDTFFTANVLSFFALGLPAYIIIKILVTCFFAREDTKTPLYISSISVISNIVLSLVLIQSMREMGIATATAISAWINAGLLYLILQLQSKIILDSLFFKNTIKIIVATIILAFVASYLSKTLFIEMNEISMLMKIIYLIGVIAICKIIYLGLIIVLKVLSFNDLKGYIKK